MFWKELKAKEKRPMEGGKMRHRGESAGKEERTSGEPGMEVLVSGRERSGHLRS